MTVSNRNRQRTWRWHLRLPSSLHTHKHANVPTHMSHAYINMPAHHTTQIIFDVLMFLMFWWQNPSKVWICPSSIDPTENSTSMHHSFSHCQDPNSWQIPNTTTQDEVSYDWALHKVILNFALENWRGNNFILYMAENTREIQDLSIR